MISERNYDIWANFFLNFFILIYMRLGKYSSPSEIRSANTNPNYLNNCKVNTATTVNLLFICYYNINCQLFLKIKNFFFFVVIYGKKSWNCVSSFLKCEYFLDSFIFFWLNIFGLWLVGTKLDIIWGCFGKLISIFQDFTDRQLID